MTNDEPTSLDSRFGPRTVAVRQVLDMVAHFSYTQHTIMFFAYAAVWDCDLLDGLEDARGAVSAAMDDADRVEACWNAREDAFLAAGGEDTWGAVDDAAQAEVVADLIPVDTYQLLTSVVRLARDHPDWPADRDLWPFFLELVPALGIDGARQAVELTALPRA